MSFRTFLFSAFSAASAVGLTGCMFTRAAEAPLSAGWQPAPTSPRGVVVFLPGLGDDPEAFVEHGFVDTVHQYGYDTLTLDAHFGYYRERTIKARLREDVLAGLRDRYDEVWLVGISLGGLGSAMYCSEWGDDVTGVVLLAPYLGDEDVWGEIEAAGGLDAWDPGSVSDVADRDAREFRRMWAWLKMASSASEPRLYVGIGADDRFRRPTRLVADMLPPEAREIRPGGHKWTTWTPIFKTLARRALAPEPITRTLATAPTASRR